MTRFQANMILVFASIIWGSTFVVQQVATGDLGAISFTSARFFMGALIVLPFALVQLKQRQKEEQKITRLEWMGMVLTGLALFSAAVLQQIGIFHTTVANAGFLTALYVPMVPFFAFFALKKTIHWSIWPASIGCLVGTFIMSGAKNLNVNAGDIWVIASAFFWAVHVILVGTMASRTRAPLVVAVVQFFTCATAGLIVGFFVEHPQIAYFAGAFLGILYTGFLSVGIAFTLQVVAQRYTPAADTAIILSAETVFAALAGFIFLGEGLSPLQLAGATMILSSILAVQLLPIYARRQT
ncbi:MAG: DMT family transporter [Desulfobacteraceae bacterium]|nr:DMT family transporter [Desulfobacteraceae bacterium]